MTPPQNVIFQSLTQFKTKFCMLAFYSCIKDSKKKKNPDNFKDKIFN